MTRQSAANLDLTGLRLVGTLSDMTWKGTNPGTGEKRVSVEVLKAWSTIFAIQWSQDGKTLRCTINEDIGGWITDDAHWVKTDYDWEYERQHVLQENYMGLKKYNSFQSAASPPRESFDGVFNAENAMFIRWIDTNTRVASLPGVVDDVAFNPVAPVLAAQQFNDVLLWDYSDLQERVKAISRVSFPRSQGTSLNIRTSPLMVFLCHANEDKPKIRELSLRLQQDGFAPWFDERDLKPGQNWRAEISRALRRSQTVVVCLSKISAAKVGYVQREIKIALDFLDKHPDDVVYLIPARLEPCVVPYQLSHLHAVDLFKQGGYEELKASLVTRALGLRQIDFHG